MIKIKKVIKWEVIPFIGDVIKYGFMTLGIMLAVASPYIISLFVFNFFGIIGAIITYLLIIGLIISIMIRTA
jgi:hypothetical protein